ncbi:serine/threonine protein kinase [Polyangium sorediatum]|uniref:Serine/threonine-protein kinase n=1 Tax=Polyangium sorediatum TaxID=889274 RepID=A0ABT6NPB4_9BACT|nr:serine/threonine-protein kinase [Polyangium sorediatum]MDI1430161.1 serine/threonine-protein kinase [Polyangium sorediatum]
MSPRDVQIGDILADKYLVERILGRGGMGVVVAALHLDLHERRAIKLMLPEQLGNAVAVERFLREARATVRLRSEHLTQIHDIGRLDSGAPYIVMELLHGLDLAQILEKTGPLPTDLAALYVFQACKALAEAHAGGIVHRDIKPSNLFSTSCADGSPCIKVLDFGISKQLPLPGIEPVDVTGQNDVMGSLLYMSPEQMRSAKNVDGRTDVWSLGVTLYKLVTNRAPFEASNQVELFTRILGGAPCEPPRIYRPDLDPGLEEVILRCLVHDVGARMPSVVDLMSALKPYLPGNAPRSESPTNLRPPLPSAPPVTAEPSADKARSRLRVPITMATSGLLMLAGAAALRWPLSPPPEAPAIPAAPPLASTPSPAPRPEPTPTIFTTPPVPAPTASTSAMGPSASPAVSPAASPAAPSTVPSTSRGSSTGKAPNPGTPRPTTEEGKKPLKGAEPFDPEIF